MSADTMGQGGVFSLKPTQEGNAPLANLFDSLEREKAGLRSLCELFK